MKKISILGSGWLGLDLAKELKKSYFIKFSTRSKDKYDLLKKDFDMYLFDMKNLDDRFFDSDILIINIPSKDIEIYKKIADKIKQNNISKVIFVSSTAVYKNTNGIVKEDDAIFLANNIWLDIENIFLEIEQIQTIVLRFAGLIGYDRNIVRHFQYKEVKNSKAPVNMIHKDDCISIIKNLIDVDVDTGIFNCCASSHPSKEEFYTYSAIKSGYNIPKFDEKKESYKIIDNTKLIKRLGYRYIHDDLLTIDFKKV